MTGPRLDPTTDPSRVPVAGLLDAGLVLVNGVGAEGAELPSGGRQARRLRPRT